MRLVSPAFLFTPLVAAAMLSPLAAAAQSGSTAEWLDRCRRDHDWNDRERACVVREVTIPTRGSLRIDGRENGGITVTGWERNEIRIVARIEAQALSQATAQALADGVEIRTGSEVVAQGPSTRSRESWWVSYDVYVPRHIDLDLSTHNGGIRVADVDGQLRFDAVNGGVGLSGLSGDVRGATENGGVRVALDGDRWRGAGLDVRTQNGGVSIEVPSSYNAELETGTVNGRVDLDFPITVSGRLGRSLSTRLGNGRAPIRVRTQNGGVSLRRR